VGRFLMVVYRGPQKKFMVVLLKKTTETVISEKIF